MTQRQIVRYCHASLMSPTMRYIFFYATSDRSRDISVDLKEASFITGFRIWVSAPDTFPLQSAASNWVLYSVSEACSSGL
jgi:hypothetical protein